MFDSELKTLLGAIKEDIAEIKPQIRCARDHVIELKTNVSSIHERLGDLEEKTLDVLKSLPSLQTQTSKNEFEIKEIKNSRSKIIYWALGVVVVLIGAVVGWVGTVSGIKSDVEHLTEQQTEIRSVLKTHSKSSRLTMKGN
jgi:DNA repair exonuclease SbcCD ATPase subunit